MGLAGPGESALMNSRGCLDRPTAGEYRCDGADVALRDGEALAALRREAFGFIFQSYHLIPTATAAENVEIPAIYAGLPAAERRERAPSLLASLGPTARIDPRPSQLSAGPQQRGPIRRALTQGETGKRPVRGDGVANG